MLWWVRHSAGPGSQEATSHVVQPRTRNGNQVDPLLPPMSLICFMDRFLRPFSRAHYAEGSPPVQQSGAPMSAGWGCEKNGERARCPSSPLPPKLGGMQAEGGPKAPFVVGLTMKQKFVLAVFGTPSERSQGAKCCWPASVPYRTTAAGLQG